MKMIISFYIVLIVCIFYSWSSCHTFSDRFHFNLSRDLLQATDLQHYDVGRSTIITKIFHNKIVVLGITMYRYMSEFWDIEFLINILTPVGIYSFLLGVFLLTKKKMQRKYLYMAFLYIGMIQLIEIVLSPSLPFIIKLFLYVLPFHCISLLGIFGMNFARNKKIVFIIIGILLLSFYWGYFMKDQIAMYCS